jgi:hypothetical protein
MISDLVRKDSRLRAEIFELGSHIRRLRQAGVHDAAIQLLLSRKRADLECLMNRTRGNRSAA